MKTYAWLVRREFWENRAIWIMPLVIGCALILAAAFGRVELGMATSAGDSPDLGGMLLFAFGVIFIVVMNIYATWYLLDCLYSERKDRSVLFWKSLPVSDTATVLAKLFTGVIAIPLVYFLTADLTTFSIAVILSIRGQTAAGELWRPDRWLQLQALWLYLIVTTAIWYAPVAGWLMVVSAWARRAVLLWSVLPLAAACVLERWFFGTHVLTKALGLRLLGYARAAFNQPTTVDAWSRLSDTGVPRTNSLWPMLDPLRFLENAQTWVGVAVGAALLVGAIQLRLRRCES